MGLPFSCYSNEVSACLNLYCIARAVLEGIYSTEVHGTTLLSINILFTQTANTQGAFTTWRKPRWVLGPGRWCHRMESTLCLLETFHWWPFLAVSAQPVLSWVTFDEHINVSSFQYRYFQDCVGCLCQKQRWKKKTLRSSLIHH